MAQQSFNFSTANFDVKVLSVSGFAGAPSAFVVRMGGGLFRALYEYRGAGLAAGELDAGPPARPVNPLAALSASFRISMPLLGETPAYADESGTVSWSRLSPYMDDQTVTCVVADPAYIGDDVALPTVKTWAIDLGGTYEDL